MSFFVFLMVLFFLTKRDRRKSDLFRTLFGLGIALSVITSVFSFTSIPGIVIALAIIAWLFNRENVSEKKQKQANDQKRKQWEQQTQREAGRQNTWEKTSSAGSSQGSYHYAGSSGNTSRKVSSFILPRAVGKRRRILEAFNKKYTLSLTDEEMKRIVDASYMSEGWKRELEAMTVKYETVYEWFNASTGWLRVYVYVFQMQNISSDFARQEGICVETFDEVMRYAESLRYMTLEERIERVNDRFFTNFDETSFMLAYRFMQGKGKTYDLNKIDIVQNETEAERMAKKYQTAQQ